jgi:hypothetical protein
MSHCLPLPFVVYCATPPCAQAPLIIAAFAEREMAHAVCDRLLRGVGAEPDRFWVGDTRFSGGTYQFSPINLK